MLFQLKMNELKSEIVINNQDECSINLEKLANYPATAAILHEILSPCHFNTSTIQDIAKSVSSVSGKMFYSPTHRLVKDREKLLISPIVPEKVVVNGTHTHTAPTLSLTASKLPAADNIMDYLEVIDFLAERIADAAVTAWKNRKPGKIAFGLEFGVIGWSRRTVYADGRAAMYGGTNQGDFRAMEAMEDHDIGSIFFLDENDKPLAVAVNVACPSQVVEGRHKINADFWHPVRETLAKRFGENLVVLGWCSAAGDIAPRPIYRKAAVERMNSLRGLDEMPEIARKIDRAVADTWEAVRTTASSDVPLAHRVETLQLPMRKVTGEEYAQAKAECEKIAAALKANPNKAHAEVDWMAGGWHGGVVERYEAQQKDPDVRYPSTIHVIRLGDTAIFTNQFELFPTSAFK